MCVSLSTDMHTECDLGTAWFLDETLLRDFIRVGLFHKRPPGTLRR